MNFLDMDGVWHVTWNSITYFGVCILSPFISLLKYMYFQTNSLLPKPDGPLSTVVPSSSIVAEVKLFNGHTHVDW